MVEKIIKEMNFSSFYDDIDLMKIFNDLSSKTVNKLSFEKDKKNKEIILDNSVEERLIILEEVQKKSNKKNRQINFQQKEASNNTSSIQQYNINQLEPIKVNSFQQQSFIPLSSSIGYPIIYQPIVYPNIYQINQANLKMNNFRTKNAESTKCSKYFTDYIKPLFSLSDTELFYTIITEKANKIIQQFLKVANYKEIKLFLYSIINILSNLMKNNISNLFIQKLFSLLHSKERLNVLSSLKSNFISLCCSFYSTYCVQELINTCKFSNEEDFVMSLIVDNLSIISTDKLGNHVLQCILYKFKSGSLSKIESFILNNTYNLSKNIYGISLMKVFIEVIKDENNKIKRSLINIIQNHKFIFFVDKIAHYLVLHIMKVWKYNDYRKIIEYCIEHYNDFLNNIYSQRILKEIKQIFPLDKQVRLLIYNIDK